MIKRIAIGLAMLVGGLGIGGAGAYAAVQLFPQYFPGLEKTAPASDFVEGGTILTPLVFADGRLAGYAAIDCQLEVPKGTGVEVGARLPLFQNAVNMRTFRKPLAAGPDGMLPNLAAVRTVLREAAMEVYGKDLVRKVVISRASPV